MIQEFQQVCNLTRESSGSYCLFLGEFRCMNAFDRRKLLTLLCNNVQIFGFLHFSSSRNSQSSLVNVFSFGPQFN